MNRSILKITVAAFVLIPATVASAADYETGVITKAPSETYTDVEFGSGWYIRGDIGFQVDTEVDSVFTRSGVSGSVGENANTEYSAGVGFGYYFNDIFRSDFQFDYQSGGEWDGSTFGCGAAFSGECSSDIRGEFEAHTASVNGYVHLGRFGRFSPYVGAGVGITHLEFTGATATLNCTLDPNETCDLGDNIGGAQQTQLSGAENFANEDSVNFSYSLHAGADFRIDENWSVDVNYRFTHITDETLSGSTTSTNTLGFDGVELHEVRGGLRYDIW